MVFIAMDKGVVTLTNHRKIYLIECKGKELNNYRIKLPYYALSLTQLLAIVLMLLLPQNVIYRKITPMEFNWLLALCYCALLFLSIYISVIWTSTQLSATVIFSLFCFMASWLFLNDIFNKFIEKYLITIALSFVLVFLIMLLDLLIVEDAWFLNDIIAFMVAGALIKFVVIKRLKASLLPLSTLWLCFAIRQFVIKF